MANMSNGNNNAGLSAWKRSTLSYVANGNALQTVDVWLPDDAPRRDGLWLIYIHGGAWRDPMVDSSSFTQTVAHVIASSDAATNTISGLASINYSLSPHPKHPDAPAPVPGPGVEAILSRSAKHPDHIIDVLRALALLDTKFSIGSRYVLAGHSCGATLAFQVAMNRELWLNTHAEQHELRQVPKPIAILGLNGLYDLPRLISEPGSTHQHLPALYEAFVRLAFGDDEETWESVSPTSVQHWSKVWPEGKLVILTQSPEDSLVHRSQTDFMLKNLAQSAKDTIEVEETDSTGDHNDLWKHGGRLAAIIVDAVQKLT